MVRRGYHHGTGSIEIPAFLSPLQTLSNCPLDLLKMCNHGHDRLNDYLKDTGNDEIYLHCYLDEVSYHHGLRELFFRPQREILLERDNSM